VFVGQLRDIPLTATPYLYKGDHNIWFFVVQHTPPTMDIWHMLEVWDTRDQASTSLNWARFGINIFAGGLILAQTIQVLYTSVREGVSARNAKRDYSVPFNFTFPTLFLLTTQYAALACAAWFAATPMPDYFLVSMNQCTGWIE